MVLPTPGNGQVCPTPGDVINAIPEFFPFESNTGHFGTFSPAIYDTAWLSMVRKLGPEGPEYLFPECFDYLLETQKDDGTWAAYASEIDGILNTLAGLFAMVKRKEQASLISNTGSDLDGRIRLAQAGAQVLLQAWNVDDTVHVGFEVLVTALLRQLGAFGILFHFRGRSNLEALYEIKMRRFSTALIYSPKKTTILHSLEALIGLIQFDEVSHHCSEEAGIFGSPAATAAYLMYSSRWDQRAETYLRKVVISYGGDGRVPSAFPTSIFEISWALSTLLSHDTSLANKETHAMCKVTAFLSTALEDGKGLVGFAPGMLEDADDTARTMIALRRLGKPVDPAPLLQQFKAERHFRTYQMERNPSFSANCNALLALLELESVEKYLPQIKETTAFLLGQQKSEKFSDKWNISPQYSAMLVAETFTVLLRKRNTQSLQLLPSRMVHEQIPAALCRLLLTTLDAQQEDGSWDASVEVTSYGVLTIAHCFSLPWNESVSQVLRDALSRGRDFIISQYPKNENDHYVWVEKTTFQSSLLKMAYCSSALYAKVERFAWSQEIADSFSLPVAHAGKMQKLLRRLPIFRGKPLVCIDLILLEAAYLANYLKGEKNSILPRDTIPMSKDKYLDYIPVIWLACSQTGGSILSASIIRDMVLLSLYNYQMDEYTESVISELEDADIQELVLRIRDACGLDSDSLALNNGSNGHCHLESGRKQQKTQNETMHMPSGTVSQYASIGSVLAVLKRFINHVLRHPAVTQSPDWARRELAIEVHNYLLSQITHNNDNISWSSSKPSPGRGYTPNDVARGSYFKWVHSTGSDDTSCPFSFRFFSCLISKPGKACFGEPRARYLSQSLVWHLAALCRQYNDVGSVARDAKENNLNSLDFAEFQLDAADGLHIMETHRNDASPLKDSLHHQNGDSTHALPHARMLDKAKEHLMEIAEFERSSMGLALQSLASVVQSPASMGAVRTFIDVTDTFGQIYIQQDIASRRELQKAA